MGACGSLQSRIKNRDRYWIYKYGGGSENQSLSGSLIRTPATLYNRTMMDIIQLKHNQGGEGNEIQSETIRVVNKEDTRSISAFFLSFHHHVLLVLLRFASEMKRYGAENIKLQLSNRILRLLLSLGREMLELVDLTWNVSAKKKQIS